MSTKIEWTDEVWNPVTGCNKVSAGCKNCYAETLAKRFWGKRKFTDVVCHEDRLMLPYKFKPYTKVFVNSMSDLFHEQVPFSFIYKVFARMTLNHNITFQILTKRPKRMLDFINHYNIKSLEKNIWLGVSVENQETANERIPLLLQVPAAVRFLSCEPLLGNIDFKIIQKGGSYVNLLSQPVFHENGYGSINWVIVGGESGHGARPMHPDWVRNIQQQCEAANVPFFFKQWGEWISMDRPLVSSEINALPTVEKMQKVTSKNYQRFDGHSFYKVGKKKAGALLDGKEYKCFPHQ